MSLVSSPCNTLSNINPDGRVSPIDSFRFPCGLEQQTPAATPLSTPCPRFLRFSRKYLIQNKAGNFSSPSRPDSPPSIQLTQPPGKHRLGTLKPTPYWWARLGVGEGGANPPRSRHCNRLRFLSHWQTHSGRREGLPTSRVGRGSASPAREPSVRRPA